MERLGKAQQPLLWQVLRHAESVDSFTYGR